MKDTISFNGSTSECFDIHSGVKQGCVLAPTLFSIDNYELEAVHAFTYLGSTISDNVSLDTELNKRIGKAATSFARLNNRVWGNSKLTVQTKVQVYKACILSTLLYANESWAPRVTNSEILKRAKITSMATLLIQRRLRWLGHVHHINDGRIPKDLLYGELSTGKRPTGRPQRRFKDVCKRGLKATNRNPNTWDMVACDRDR